jgi:Asp-tRNA(Asn)/Glu-tRNA(Gln) amidotransferase A subunit family amidase
MTHDRIERRSVLRALAATGVGTIVFNRALAAQMESSREITLEMIQQAEWIAGVEYSDEERRAALRAMQSQLRKLDLLRATSVAYSTPPAVAFNPTPGLLSVGELKRGQATMLADNPLKRPADTEDQAFLPVTALAHLLRTRQMTSVELTRLYLERLRQFDPVLNCVVTYVDELALRQAQRADEEIAAGQYRGPLHGVPWGAKDLIAVPGYKTTWGATPFENQVLDVTATVAQRLEEAGAVLIAKLSLGALAWGDGWFRGKTRNPWNPDAGSSGSSAGSAAATAAGLVGFSIGSETLGSIISPCRVCGTTGLRPTFGRVSRYGCMALAWSMDKLGPICRSVEDCALVLDAIHGADGRDASAVDRPFDWPPSRDVKSLRVGYIERKNTGDKDPPPPGTDERPELKVLRELGVTLVPISLPEGLPVSALTVILDAESTTVFDELVRTNRLEGTGLWPDSFRRGQLIPAVEYLRANRIRFQLMQQMAEVMKQVDCYVGGNDLTITNLTGHPTVVLPVGVESKEERELPRTITFTGQLYGEAELLLLARAYEQAIRFSGRPDMKALRERAK